MDPRISTLSAFADHGVGYLSRPPGRLVFGHFSDRVGRETMLMPSILAMGVGTLPVGCLATDQDVGVWAPICLVTLGLPVRGGARSRSPG